VGGRFNNDVPIDGARDPGDGRSSDGSSTDAVGTGADAVSGVRVPPSVETQVVLACFQDAAAPAGDVVATHLWVADERSGTLRLVDATGPFAPSGTPIRYEDDDPVATAFRTMTVAHAPVARLRIGGQETTTWRWAMPLQAGDTVGVAAIDLHAKRQPDMWRLPERTAVLRGSLTGALALYLADQRLATAHSLVDTARELSRILDPREVLETALLRAMDVSGAQTGSIMLADSQTKRLTIAVSRGLPDDVVQETELGEGSPVGCWPAPNHCWWRISPSAAPAHGVTVCGQRPLSRSSTTTAWSAS
jgi:hypothetical protein